MISEKDLSIFFHQLCDASAAETLPRFRTGTQITNKTEGGFDPVTEADREVEKVIRKLIEEKFPNHGIVGEEFPNLKEEAEYIWVIDPVDGTRAFVAGLPVWGTLVGLCHHGKPVAGMMYQPFTGELYFSNLTSSYLENLSLIKKRC